MGKILRSVREPSGRLYIPTPQYALNQYEKAIKLLNDSFRLIRGSRINFKLKKDKDLKAKMLRQYNSLGKDLSDMKKRIRLD